MKIMQGKTREDAHWGQCFEEFYGAEYSKNLRKDLEKLKDEFYEGNPQRFQREWVLPTANLLRRMRHMGFPVRTRDFVFIHLYNPVDSMCAGEMHLQVGRKIPGTLTLKFTKQNSNGAFVIQPKTLSGADESKLSYDPIGYFDDVRREMRDSSVDSAAQLTTIVLMTDFCKLERKSLKQFLTASMGRTETVVATATVAPTLPLSNSFAELPSSCPPPTSIPFNSGHWAAAAAAAPIVPNALNPETMTRPDANFPFWQFCVKNYVNYGGAGSGERKSSTGMAVPMGISGVYPTGSYTNIGNVFRQSRSSNWHSEPEENDETLNLLSINEQQRLKDTRTSATGVEEIQRRMSDSKLWDAPGKIPSTRHISTSAGENGETRCPIQPTSSAATTINAGSHQQPQNNNHIINQQPDRNILSRLNPVGSAPRDIRTNVIEDYASDNQQTSPEILVNDANISDVTDSHLPLRRDSDTRTSLTDQYLTGTSSSANYNSYGLCCSPLDGVSSGSPNHIGDVGGRRTSHTEVYAGEPHASSGNVDKNPFSGAFTNAMQAARENSSATSGRAGPRATVTEDYARNHAQLQMSGVELGAFQQCASSANHRLPVPMPHYTSASPENFLRPGSGDGSDDSKPRTSSLDAYVGEAAQPPMSATSKIQAWQGGITKAHSTGDVNRSNQLWSNQRTTMVDEYLGGGGGGGDVDGGRYGTPHVAPPIEFQSRSSVNYGVRFQSPAASMYSSTSSSDATNGFESSNGFDSWGSHCPDQGSGMAARGDHHNQSVYGQQNQVQPLMGGRLGSERMVESCDKNDMSLLSHTSFPSWGSHHCGPTTTAVTTSYNRVLIPLTVEEYSRELLQDSGGGGGAGTSVRPQYLSSDS